MSEHPQKDLAPRDVVARAIFGQLSKGNKVFLDATLIDVNKIKKRFPNIYKTCLDNGIDVTKDYIPVSPAAHYCMGGIKTEINGKTSIDNLYAIGETACTSLHGANRLASNVATDAPSILVKNDEKEMVETKDTVVSTTTPTIAEANASAIVPLKNKPNAKQQSNAASIRMVKP